MKQRSYRIRTGALMGTTAAAMAVAWLVPGSTAGDVPPVLTSAGVTAQQVVCPASHEAWLSTARRAAQRQQASPAAPSSATQNMVVAVPGQTPVTVTSTTLPQYSRSGDTESAPVPQGRSAGITVDAGSNGRVFAVTEMLAEAAGADPVAVTVDSETGELLRASGWSMTTARGGLGQGLAVGRCVTPATESWLVSGGSRASESSTVVLANPDSAPVTVNLRLFTSQGVVNPAGGRGVLVPPQTHVRLLLGGLVSTQESLAVQVDTEGGPIAAYSEDIHTDGVASAGLDIVTATVPSTPVVIPGVSAASESGATVRIVNPGDVDTIVSWLALGESTASALPEATRTIKAGTVQEIAVPPEYREDPGALVLTSEHPVVAAVSVARRTGQTSVTTPNNALVDVDQPRRDTYDLMWLPAAPALPTTAEEAVVVPLPNADQDVRGSLVVAAQTISGEFGADGDVVTEGVKGGSGFSAPVVVNSGQALANGSTDGAVERIPLGGGAGSVTQDSPETGVGVDPSPDASQTALPSPQAPPRGEDDDQTFDGGVAGTPGEGVDDAGGAVLWVAPVGTDGVAGQATEYRLRPGTAMRFEFAELFAQGTAAMQIWATGQPVHANVLLTSATGDAAMAVAARSLDATQWQVWINEPAEGVAAATK